MNAKLLQKIEELTLYMIDVNKKVSGLQVNNEKLTDENKVLIRKVESMENKK
jgi:cell division protein FtsB